MDRLFPYLAVAAVLLAGAAFFLVLRAIRRPSGDAGEKRLAEGLQGQITALNQQIFKLSQDNADQILRLTNGTGEALRGVAGQVQKFVSDSQSQIQGMVASSQKQVNARLDESGRMFEGIQKGLASLQNETTHMAELGRDMQKLREILGSPKLRGNLGEEMLERILRQVLPPDSFRMPYKFPDGLLVDAAVLFREGPGEPSKIVPIDSKFPLDNYRKSQEPGIAEEEKTRRWKDFCRDVRARVDEIAGKYIRPGDGTFDFAFMYVPSESIYYEIIVQDEKLGAAGSLLDHAASKKVVPVSPNSLFAYLQVVVLGLKGMKVEKEALRILEGIGKVQKDFAKFRADFEKVGKRIADADRAWHEADDRYRLLGNKMEKVTGHSQEEPALEAGAAAAEET